MGRRYASEGLPDEPPGKIEKTKGRPGACMGYRAPFRPMRFDPPAIAARKRVIDGAMGGPRRLFGTESLQRMAPAAIRWSLAAQKLPPYRSLVHRYVGRISTNDLVTTPKALIEEPIRD
jgi:hypothetical protein